MVTPFRLPVPHGLANYLLSCALSIFQSLARTPRKMSDQSMKAYLAAHYMSGPKADAILSHTTASSGATKKKKRKAGASKTGSSAAGPSFIKDDDVLGWDAIQRGEDEDEVADAVIAEDRAFKKRQRTDEGSGWATIRGGEREESPLAAEDEQPQVVEEEPKFKGGLLTGEQLKKTLPREKPAKAAAQEDAAQAQETVYRDSSGRRVDMAAERAEAARKKREREEAEAKKMEWGKGLVQREDQVKRRAEEAKMRARPFARDRDDVDMNEELMAQERWNDPAAAFLTVGPSHLWSCVQGVDKMTQWRIFLPEKTFERTA